MITDKSKISFYRCDMPPCTCVRYLTDDDEIYAPLDMAYNHSKLYSNTHEFYHATGTELDFIEECYIEWENQNVQKIAA